MNNLEEQLKQLDRMDIKTPTEGFQENLRKRLLNEYALILDSSVPHNESKWDKLKNRFSGGFTNLNAVNFAAYVVVFGILALASGIAFLPSGSLTNVKNTFGIGNKEVQITSNIEGADVYIDGKLVGKTPLDLKLKEGKYKIDVKKDGYDIYSQDIEINSEEEPAVYAELGDYRNWKLYKNDESNLAFYYPSDWQVNEENGDYIVTNGESSLTISRREEANRSNQPEMDVYVSVINAKEETQVTRFLEFNQDDKLQNAGIEDLYGYSLLYSLDLEEGEIEYSQRLKTLDTIVSSLSTNVDNESAEQTSVTAVELGFEKVEDNGEVKTGSGSQIKGVNVAAERIKAKSGSGNITAHYTNQTYGLEFDYPGIWEINKQKDSYPLSSTGFGLKNGQAKFAVAGVQLNQSDIDLKILILISNSEADPLPKNLVNCGSTESSISDTMKLSNFRYRDYSHVICKNGDPVLTAGTSKYTVLINKREVGEKTKKRIVSLIDSAGTASINVKREDLTQNYSDGIMGLKLKHPFYWTANAGYTVCSDNGDSMCKYIEFYDRNGTKKLTVSRSVPEGYAADKEHRTVEIQVGDEVADAREFYDGNDFVGGHFFDKNLKAYVSYYAPYGSQGDVKEVLKSIED